MRCIALSLMLSLFLAQSRAQSPATQPTTNPANPDHTAREALMKQWLSDLMNADASIRQRARLSLMAIRPSELPLLREACLASAPLNPSQIEPLKEIVTQLFLQGVLENDAEKTNTGFVGVRLGFGQADTFGAGEYAAGIVVYRRIPGFVGYRMLQDGDIIRGITEAPEVKMNRLQDFIDTVRKLQSGDLIHLQIVRAGKELSVPIKLDPRPEWTNRQAMAVDPDDDPATIERIHQAEDYWDNQFAPGFDPDLTPLTKKQ
jgi:hypothetical protein